MILEHSVGPAECWTLRGTRVTGKGVRGEKGQQRGNTDGLDQGQRVNN